MNMIEKMARAISKEFFGSEDHHVDFIDEAKAALECLKEPTDEMKQVVAADWGRKTWERYDWVINAALEGK